MHWQTSRFSIDLSSPKVMGIVNVTPDSFSDGGQYAASAAARAHCDTLVQQGADILDIGGESTRPGATVVGVQEELDRVLPVLEYALALGVPVSVDTYKPQVMQAALSMGADIINDVWALRWRMQAPQEDAALSGESVVAAHGRCGLCLMHMHREPKSMQLSPMEGDVVPQVYAFLAQRAQALLDLGVAAARIAVDPGVGFGKTVAQNFTLLAQQQAFMRMGYPVLAGWSRKSSLAAVAQVPVQERMVASVAAALLAVERGAAVVRVHDVKETVQALRVWSAMQAGRAHS